MIAGKELRDGRSLSKSGSRRGSDEGSVSFGSAVQCDSKSGEDSTLPVLATTVRASLSHHAAVNARHRRRQSSPLRRLVVLPKTRPTMYVEARDARSGIEHRRSEDRDARQSTCPGPSLVHSPRTSGDRDTFRHANIPAAESIALAAAAPPPAAGAPSRRPLRDIAPPRHSHRNKDGNVVSFRRQPQILAGEALERRKQPNHGSDLSSMEGAHSPSVHVSGGRLRFRRSGKAWKFRK